MEFVFVVSDVLSFVKSTTGYTLTHWGREKMDAISQTKCIFLNENVWIPIEISLKFDNIPALVW